MQVPVITRQHSILTDKAVEHSESEEAGQEQSSGGSPKVKPESTNLRTWLTL